jgi:hypothetical protein
MTPLSGMILMGMNTEIISTTPLGSITVLLNGPDFFFKLPATSIPSLLTELSGPIPTATGWAMNR